MDTLAKKTAEQPLDRAIAIVEALAIAARPMSITELAAACQLPLTTVHRMASQLEKRAMVKRAMGSKKLIVGQRLVRLGNAAVEAAMRADQPHQVLAAVAREVGESCQIGIRNDNEVVYIDTVRVTHAAGLHFEQGRRSPIYCTSIGKLYLAEMDDDDFEQWLASIHLPKLTPNTISSRSDLRKEIHHVRHKQWASNNEEFLPGVVGCAVPIRLANNSLLACLGLYVPTARMTIDQITDFLPALQRAADKIAAFTDNANAGD